MLGAGTERLTAGDNRSGLGDWHTMLLRLAGTLPDDLICEARSWLAEGGLVDVAQAIGFAAATGRVPVLGQDAELMAGELQAAGEDDELISALERLKDGASQHLPWIFSSTDPRRPEGVQGPLDLTLALEQQAQDELDRVMVSAARAEIGLIAVWRSWRAPADGSPWPTPRLLFVVQAAAPLEPHDLPAVTARLQAALSAAGEPDPQVEVCGQATMVPAYQSNACARGALIWTSEPTAPVRMARVFDSVDPEHGPLFDENHPRIDDLDEVIALLRYLGDGLPVLTTSVTMADVLDPERPEVVPLTFRTDGRWVWTDTITYYLERYGLAPEPELLYHLQLAKNSEPDVSDVALHRVLSMLQRPTESKTVWTVPAARPGIPK
ncbi:hypothetical protein Kisp01_70790 [Kineosporia sp. NBRC 101677]|uniref:hypothetical protein n=1 Tax=Kineosporia sp. NBRC 101677 TaxID=3032197 RepID=UPI0024A027E1|nr:hypothetical protein [Kineosporia sp. NBRC 101677]GLY20065.1 hypothetical protein Kisp01_70790 [Kineosporia sp. NBRC 101677]